MFFRKLEIHAWGGLGSQLFALAFALEFMRDKPKVNIKLVLHSSGVTKRESELDFVKIPNIEISSRDDFIMNQVGGIGINSTHLKKFSVLIRKTLRYVISKIFMSVNSDPPDELIRPWTKQVRSHYYRRPIPLDLIQEMCNILDIFEDVSVETSKLCLIHYRLGDLLTLDSKSPIEPYRMRNAARQGIIDKSENQVAITSDSPTEAIELLKDELESFVVTIIDSSPFETLKFLTYANILIASPSKLSLWGIIFGIALGVERTVYIPKELLSDLKSICSAQGNTRLVPF